MALDFRPTENKGTTKFDFKPVEEEKKTPRTIPVTERALGFLGDTKFFQEAASGLTTGEERSMAQKRIAQARQSGQVPDIADMTTVEKDTFGEHTAKTLFGKSKSFFDNIVNKLSETEFIKGAAEGMRAIEAGEVEGDTLDFLGTELLGNLSEVSQSYAGRGTANLIDTMIASPLNFSTRAIYGKSNPLGDFMSDFASEMRNEFTTERSRKVAEQEFSADKAKSADFWMTSVAENIPVTLGFMGAASKAYALTGRATQLFGTSRFAQVAANTVNALVGGSTMRGFESAAEAEEAYKQARAEGKSEKDALEAGQAVFSANMKLAGLDAVQVAIALSPLKSIGGSNVLTKIIGETAKLALGGATEGAEEIFQYGAQERALGHTDKSMFQLALTDPQAQESGFIGAAMGVLFQAGGRIKQYGEEKTQEKYMDLVSEKLPDEIKAQYDDAENLEAKQGVLDAFAETNPEDVGTAVREVESDVQKKAQATKETYNAIRSVPSSSEITSRLQAGESPAEIKVSLAQTIGADEATTIVDSVVASRSTAVEDTQKKLTEVTDYLDKTPVDLQEEFNTTNKEFETRISEVQTKIAGLEEQLKNAPARTAQKSKLKEQIAKARKEQAQLEKDMEASLVGSAESFRTFLGDYVGKTYANLSDAKRQRIVDNVVAQATEPSGIRRSFFVPVGRMIEAQAERVSRQPEPVQKPIPKKEAEKPTPKKKEAKQEEPPKKPEKKPKKKEKKADVKPNIQEEEAMKNVNPTLYKLAKEASTIENFLTAVEKSKSKAVKDISEADLRDWYGRIDRGDGGARLSTKKKGYSQLSAEAKKFDSVEEFIAKIRGSATQYTDYTPELRIYGTTIESDRISNLGVDPEMDVTIYRGVPSGVTEIRQGDFVTTDVDSAWAYSGEKPLSKEVKAKDLIVEYPDEFDAENPFETGAEFVYSPSENGLVKYSDEELRDIYNEAKRVPDNTPALFSMKDSLKLTDTQGAMQAEMVGVIEDLQRGNLSFNQATRKMEKLWESAKATFSPEQFEVLQTFTRFQLKNADQSNTQVQSRFEFLEDIKKRWKIDFDVHFVDTILAGTYTDALKKKSVVEAWGAYADNTIALVKDAVNNTDRHEVVHLTIDNAENIPIMRENGITKEKLLRAQADELGIDYDKTTAKQRIEIEERIAKNFESYQKQDYTPKGIIRKFFVFLERLLLKMRRLLGLNDDILRDYYDLLEEGVDTNARTAYFENKGLIESFINDGVLDLRGTELSVDTEAPRVKRLSVAKLQVKPEDDKLLQKTTKTFNDLTEQQDAMEQNLAVWRADLFEELEKRDMLVELQGEVPMDVKRRTRYVTTNKGTYELTARAEEALERIAETDPQMAELLNDELVSYVERREEIKQSQARLNDFRKTISEARKEGTERARALRDVERRMKLRTEVLQRKQYYVSMGEKRGYKRGAIDARKDFRETLRQKNARKAKIDKLKQIYKRVRQATKTGSYLPVDYQTRLLELFDSIDFATMTEKTQNRLEATAAFFEKQSGDVPSDIAERLKRLSKTSVGEMSDVALDELVDTVMRIYEQGVLKKKLLRSRDKKTLQANIAKLVESTHPFGKEVIGKSKNSFVNRMRRNVDEVSASLYDPARFASYVDGAVGYTGEHFNQVVEPTRQAINEAEIQTSSILKRSFDTIKDISESFTDDEMARMVYYSALEQGGQEQANALEKQYPDIDFSAPLTPKEAGALEVMKYVFKEIRPEVAATFESIKNTPFPDNENYFPYRYDQEVETYDIEENSFDFDVKKTSQGFTMERENKVDRVLDINIFETFVSSVKKQVYYSKVQPELENIKALLNSKEYQEKADVVTKNYWSQFVTDVATQGRRQGTWSFLDWVRGNVSVAILGYKISTVIIQISGAFDGMMNVKEQLGWKAAAKVFPELVSLAFNKAKLDNTVESSLELQNRKGGQIEIAELQSMYKGMFSPSWYIRSWNKYKENAYIGIQATDMRVAASIFNVLKNGYMKEGMSETEATAMAEQVMILSQSSHSVANRPQVLVNSTVRFFFPFSSFIFNAFNNARYDGVKRELKKSGFKKGMIAATGNLSFIGMAVTYEMVMYMAISSLFGYDDEDTSLWKRFFAGAISRVPGAGYFIAFDGSFEGLRVNNPGVEAVDKAVDNVAALFSNGATNREVYNIFKNSLVFLGFPGTQQYHQILTAPDVAGMGSIGRSLGISYDDRRNAEKRVDVLKPIIAEGKPIQESDIDSIASDVYGKDFDEGDAQYKKNKREEIIREIAIREEYGFDDPIINVLMDNKGNNEVKAVVARQDDPYTALKKYKKSVVRYNEVIDVFSDALYKELLFIAKADPETREKVAQLAEAEDDADRDDVIKGDKAFARKAFSLYKVIPKAYYESI